VPELPPAPPAPARLTATVLGPLIGLSLAWTLLVPLSRLRTFSTSHLVRIVVVEAVVGFVLIGQLARHDWRWAHFTRPFESRDLARGFGVFVFGQLCFYAGLLLAWALSPTIGQTLSTTMFLGHPSLWAVVAASPLNAIFEESMWLGYAVRGPGRDRPGPSAAWSIGARCAVHLYQGPAALFLIGPLGLWYWRYYRRTGRLWPVIVGHTLQDIVALVWLTLRSSG
jgi:CAAX protease family protein